MCYVSALLSLPSRFARRLALVTSRFSLHLTSEMPGGVTRFQIAYRVPLPHNVRKKALGTILGVDLDRTDFKIL